MTEQTEQPKIAKRYTPEQRADFLKQKEEEGLTVEQAAAKFGVSKGSITGWMQKTKPVKEKKEKKEVPYIPRIEKETNDHLRNIILEMALKNENTRNQIIDMIIMGSLK